MKDNIIERNTVEVDGVKKINVQTALLEIDARIKTIYQMMDEIKEVLQGQAKWSEETDIRLQKLDPKLLLSGDKDFQDTVNQIKI